MGIVNGKTLPPAEPPRIPVRVVVKFTEAAGKSQLRARIDDARANAITELRRIVPNIEFRPYFSEGEHLRAASMAPFNRYVIAEVQDRTTAADLARKLQALDFVEEAYVEAGPMAPPVNPADDPRSWNQGHLDAAPDGIDARWAWSLTNGSGIMFVDLEQGWTLNHEDLAGAGITIISGINQAYFGHGTSVLGEVVAVDNKLGGIGIAPSAQCRVVSEWRDRSGNWNRAAAILSAGQVMRRGDVLLLEAQTAFGSWTKIPVEVEVAVFDAIRHVVDDGIVVVEAAGNGGYDLDTFVDASNRHVLDRSSSDFRDSGAIMVGAASSAAPHSRLSFSCYGSRIDCYGWGQGVDTTGDGWQGNGTNSYTRGFGGTSAASPIVAGAAVLLQSWSRNHYSSTYSPEELRDLFTSDLNTPSANPASDRIGVMPNLRAIIEWTMENEPSKPFLPIYIPLVYILLGLIDDSPGIIWVPGKKPVPGPYPGWIATARKITGPKRDLIAALAMNEIVELIDDEATRTRLADATGNAMRGAVDRIGRTRGKHEMIPLSGTNALQN